MPMAYKAITNIIYTIRYNTIDDLHWKTDRQAASFM